MRSGLLESAVGPVSKILRLKFTCRRHPQNARRDDQGEMDLRASTSAAQGRTGPRSFRRPLLGWITSTCIDDNDRIRFPSSPPSQSSGAEKKESGGRRHNRACQLSDRSEEHTSELQSLMRSSYAVFCLKKQKNNIYYTKHIPNI